MHQDEPRSHTRQKFAIIRYWAIYSFSQPHANPRFPAPSTSLVSNKSQRPHNPRQKSFSKRSASLETPREAPLPKTIPRLSTLPSIHFGNDIYTRSSHQPTFMREELGVCRKGASSASLPDPHRGESVVEQLSHPVFRGRPISPSRINPPACTKKVPSTVQPSSSASSILTPPRDRRTPDREESETVVSKHPPTVEVNTTLAAYTLSIHLPSFHRDEITVSLRKHRVLHVVADRFLTLSRVLHNSEDEHFEKRISFGYDADMPAVRAEFADGVLKVVVPRKEEFVVRS